MYEEIVSFVIERAGLALKKEKDVKFIKGESYFPVSGKLSDKFDDNFKIVFTATVDEATTIFLGIKWKGTAYLIATTPVTCDTYPCTVKGTAKWKYPDKIPTIKEFIEAFGEPVPEKTTAYTYDWMTGISIDETHVVPTDIWAAELLVEVPGIPWMMVIPAVAVGVAVVGLGMALTRKKT